MLAMILFGLIAPPAQAGFVKLDQVPLEEIISASGIAFDGTTWHISSLGGPECPSSGSSCRFANYDRDFAFLDTTAVIGVVGMGGLSYADNSGTLFVLDRINRVVREIELDGTILGQFPTSAAATPTDITYDGNTDTLWVAYFGTGLVENRLRSGPLISSFTSSFFWSGIAFDSASDTLLLLEGNDALLEFSKTGSLIQQLLDDQITGNGQGLDYDSSTGTLHATSQKDGVAIFQDPGRAAAEVMVDIKPASDFNPINLKSRGVIPVAILGSDTFDVLDVDVNTLAFGPAGAIGAAPVHSMGSHLEDVNNDGFTDLLSHYPTQETGIASEDTEACVVGETFDGTPFEGCDEIFVLSFTCGLGYELALLLPGLMWLRKRRRLN